MNKYFWTIHKSEIHKECLTPVILSAKNYLLIIEQGQNCELIRNTKLREM